MNEAPAINAIRDSHPAYIRSDNGPEFVAEAVRRWIATVGAWTAFIDPGSPWQNGYIESFNARLRGERLDAESSGKPRLSSKPGGAITIPSAHAAAWDTGRRPRKRSSCQAGRPAPPVTQLGGETVNAVTFKLDKSPGAGQRCLRKSVAVPVKRRTSRPRPSHAPGMAMGSGPPNSSARGGAGSPNGPEWRVLDGRGRAFENTGATTARMIHRGSR